MKKILRSLIALMMAAMLIAAPALAENPSVVLDAAVTLQGTLPDTAEEFAIVMTAEDGAPLPVEGDSMQITIKGAGKASFAALEFDHVGIYHYTIVQKPGKDKDAKYDATVYRLQVAVVNAEEGGLKTVVGLYQDGEDAKQDEALFNNVYPTILPPGEVTPTGVEDKWPWYLAGCAAMLMVCAAMIAVLRRKEEQPVVADGSNEITEQDLQELARDLNADLCDSDEDKNE